MPTKTKQKTKTMLVRIHPPSRSQGHHAQTYTLSGTGYPKFDWRQGWYTVEPHVAARLKKALNNPRDPGSRPVFQVCTPREAKALDVAETEVVAKADAPIPLPKGVKRVHEPSKADVKAKADEAADDEDMDLSDDLRDEDWDLDQEQETPETEDDEDDDLDDLVEPAPVPAKKKVVKKRVTKKKAKKRAKKKTTKKTRRR